MNGTSCIKFINYKRGTEFRHSTRVIEEKWRIEYFDISVISTNIVILKMKILNNMFPLIRIELANLQSLVMLLQRRSQLNCFNVTRIWIQREAK